MNILIIDQCSKAKEYREEARSFDAGDIDEHGLETLREHPESLSKAARKLYAGRQQQYISDAVDQLRSVGDSVDRFFISAGFGVIEETEELPPYDVTFADHSATEIRERANTLGIEDDIRNLITDGYDLIFFALGSDYYRSFDLQSILEDVSPTTWVVCFNHESITDSYENVVSLPARTEEAKEQETIVVALKGRYLQHFASHRSKGKEVTDLEDIETFCTTEYTTQTSLDQIDE
ncbi:Uncharacterized protein SVXHr_2734 [Halorhabdus sp. SVX81]|uniref:hypothetical protein n=1 Tax=Halorhabdus sp. SVX81 TaxID=2978283 RepID=UPI0023DCB0EC|nr:hypothetical protein [Halorhabdus sp. SVX81]WEL18877.1 Uncharacterized protein SVXHr_2734 [Halorhabdus sp. SVX81]